MERRDGLESIFREEALRLNPPRMSLTVGTANWRLVVAVVVVVVGGGLRNGTELKRKRNDVVAIIVGSVLRLNDVFAVASLLEEKCESERNDCCWNELLLHYFVVGRELRIGTERLLLLLRCWKRTANRNGTIVVVVTTLSEEN